MEFNDLKVLEEEAQRLRDELKVMELDLRAFDQRRTLPSPANPTIVNYLASKSLGDFVAATEAANGSTKVDEALHSSDRDVFPLSVDYLSLISGLHFDDVQLRLISRKVAVPVARTPSSSNIRLHQELGPVTRTDRRRKYLMRGTCSDLFWFAVEFESNEVETDKDAFAVIPGTLSAHADSRILDSILPFIERCEKEGDIHGFLNGMARFSWEIKNRYKLFQEIKADYESPTEPTRLIFPDGFFGETFSFQATALKFVFRWRVNIAESGKVTHDVNAAAQLDETVLENIRPEFRAELIRLARHLPSQFANLLRIKGVTRAVYLILDLLQLRGRR